MRRFVFNYFTSMYFVLQVTSSSCGFCWWALSWHSEPGFSQAIQAVTLTIAVACELSVKGGVFLLHCWLDTTLMKVNKNSLWSWRFSRCYPGLRCHICFLCGPYVDSTALIKALHLLTSNALARVTSVRNPAI